MKQTFDLLQQQLNWIKTLVKDILHKLIILRTCNQLLERISKTEGHVFYSQIRMFLTNLFPLSEKSGVNLASSFNNYWDLNYEKETATYPNNLKKDGMKIETEEKKEITTEKKEIIKKNKKKIKMKRKKSKKKNKKKQKQKHKIKNKKKNEKKKTKLNDHDYFNKNEIRKKQLITLNDRTLKLLKKLYPKCFEELQRILQNNKNWTSKSKKKQKPKKHINSRNLKKANVKLTKRKLDCFQNWKFDGNFINKINKSHYENINKKGNEGENEKEKENNYDQFEQNFSLRNYLGPITSEIDNKLEVDNKKL
ncbi:tho complex subunit [Anaeramoeba flamelloides]|uniref:Tho complex subunit n=1 Tax=Anaeramoeba flamelloides TaxID=1746091 RepID=A0AAV8A1S2_9EUKA|nr:tho complex subunit [Anaeramoeba flamelloides]